MYCLLVSFVVFYLIIQHFLHHFFHEFVKIIKNTNLNSRVLKSPMKTGRRVRPSLVTAVRENILTSKSEAEGLRWWIHDRIHPAKKAGERGRKPMRGWHAKCAGASPSYIKITHILCWVLSFRSLYRLNTFYFAASKTFFLTKNRTKLYQSNLGFFCPWLIFTNATKTPK